jgi:hypothetical protein
MHSQLDAQASRNMRQHSGLVVEARMHGVASLVPLRSMSLISISSWSPTSELCLSAVLHSIGSAMSFVFKSIRSGGTESSSIAAECSSWMQQLGTQCSKGSWAHCAADLQDEVVCVRFLAPTSARSAATCVGHGATCCLGLSTPHMIWSKYAEPADIDKGAAPDAVHHPRRKCAYCR